LGTEAGAEGVGAGVEAPGGGVETDSGKEGLKELFLIRAGVVAGELLAGGMGGDGEGLFGDGDQAGLKFFEEGGDLPGFPARLVTFEQGVIGMVGISPKLGHAAGEGEEFLQVGGEGVEVGFFPGLDPCGPGEAAGALVFLHKVGGDPGGAVVIVPPAGEAGALRAVRGWLGGLAGGEPIPDFWSGGEAVGDAGDLGGLFRTERVGLRGQKGFLVPAEEAAGGAEQGQLPSPGAQFLVGFRQSGHSGILGQENIPWNVGMLWAATRFAASKPIRAISMLPRGAGRG